MMVRYRAMSKIAILCPSRGRPKQFARMLQSVKEKSSTDVEVFLYVAKDDVTLGQYPTCNYIYTGLDFPTAYKWNMLAAKAMDAGCNILMLGADDMIFATPGWDKAIIDHYNNLENKIYVYALQDSRDKNGTPHPIVTKEYTDIMGYFVPPIFLHWYVDTWTVDIAKGNNCFTHLRDYELVHDKPSDKGAGDETHNRIRAMGWNERDKMTDYLCTHFKDFEIKRLAQAIAEKYK